MNPTTQQSRIAGLLFTAFLPQLAAAMDTDVRPRRRVGERGIKEHRRYRKMRRKMTQAARRANRYK